MLPLSIDRVRNCVGYLQSSLEERSRWLMHDVIEISNAWETYY